MPAKANEMPAKDGVKLDKSIYQRRETYIYIIMEYALIGVVLATGPVLPSNPILIFIEVIAIWHLLWVLWTNIVSKFNPSYRPKQKTRLIAKGPYQFIRYPFSTSVLLITFALVINHLTILRLIILLLLLATIIFRVRYEEKVFSQYFSDFPIYKQKTCRLIPFVF